jgi:hypothetical protein
VQDQRGQRRVGGKGDPGERAGRDDLPDRGRDAGRLSACHIAGLAGEDDVFRAVIDLDCPFGLRAGCSGEGELARTDRAWAGDGAGSEARPAEQSGGFLAGGSGGDLAGGAGLG